MLQALLLALDIVDLRNIDRNTAVVVSRQDASAVAIESLRILEKGKRDAVGCIRVLLLETRAATNVDIAIMDSEADEMLVDRERLEYDDEDGSSVASDNTT